MTDKTHIEEWNPKAWVDAMGEALISLNVAVRAYQKLLEVAPVQPGKRPFAELTIRYKEDEE